MSLITQCPACSTMFRVVPDQLRISEGWVRCGQCDEVFDANAHLQNFAEPPPVTAPAAAVAAQPHPEPLPVSTPAPANPVDAYDWGPVLGDPEPPTPAPVDDALHSELTQTATLGTAEPYFEEPVALAYSDAPEPQPAMDAFLAHSLHGSVDGPPSGLADDQSPPDAEPDMQPSADTDADALDESRVVLPSAAVGAADDDMSLSFMRQSSTATQPTRPLVRNLLVALCLLLTAFLALQYLLVERDRLAATAPALRPLLSGACALLGCTVSAPRQIESIAIESSTFSSLKPGVYVLNLTVKNTSALELEAPALELTLTGMQDQALLRKVLLPAQALGKQQMPAGAEVSVSLPVRVIAGAVADKIAGYKLLAFYP